MTDSARPGCSCGDRIYRDCVREAVLVIFRRSVSLRVWPGGINASFVLGVGDVGVTTSLEGAAPCLLAP